MGRKKSNLPKDPATQNRESSVRLSGEVREMYEQMARGDHSQKTEVLYWAIRELGQVLSAQPGAFSGPDRRPWLQEAAQSQAG